MKLPSDSDYQAAIQNPRQAFADPELRQCLPELVEGGALAGLPRPRAGNFATVYKLRLGSRAFAVRCFTRPIQPDQPVRYAGIIRHLGANPMPSSVDVDFLSQGIQVQGRWFPLVKMEWVQGESLAAHVEKHHASPRALFDLAAAWVELLRDLRRARVAHGDLQHGNVVVTPEGLRLVDYDGMFVPALAGRQSHERGHANYQHPDRAPDFFDDRLDHFSAWVVWTSLVALAHEPSLWTRFHGGDDCLLFRKKDFTERERSPLFQALLASREERVRTVASFLLGTLLPGSPHDVPPLDGAALAGLAGAGAKALPSATAAPEVARFMVPGPSAPATLGAVSLEDRQVANGLLLASGLSAVLGVALSPLWLTGLGLTGGVGWAWARSAFRRTGAVARREAVQAALGETRKQLADAEARLQRLLEERARVEEETRSRSAELLSALESTSGRRRLSLDSVRDGHPTVFARFAQRREALEAQESHARQALEGELRPREAELQQRLANLSSVEQARNEALRQRQEEHVSSALRGARIEKSSIPGFELSPQVIDQLRRHGVSTAADITGASLSSIRKLHAQPKSRLFDWRASLEQRARESMPTKLPEAQRVLLKGNWRVQRSRVEQGLEALRAEHASRTEALAAGFAALREALRAEEEQVAELHLLEDSGTSSRWEQEAQRLQRELRAGLDTVWRQVVTARRDCATLHWCREEQERELATLDGVGFSRYLALLLKDSQEPS